MNAREPAGSVGATLHDAAGSLARLPTPRLDAEVLLAHVLDWPRARLIAHREHLLTVRQREHFATLIAARAAGTPVAYLRGRHEFWSLDLEVSDAVLVPRADTEVLVEAALVRMPLHVPCTVADLGTGSGAIALAIASERPRAFIVALELSGAALAVAEANRRRHGFGHVAAVRGRWTEALAPDRFDLLVANPPYLAAEDPALGDDGVRCEPRAALVADAAGLADLRTLARTAGRVLVAGGWLLVEHGARQAGHVRDLLATEFTDVDTVIDLAGHARVTCARKRISPDGR
ncbi:MAG: peptide chain release factor N(5)-glutamine methyltransferase [Gammaproteobacteria bacterium]